MKMNFKFFLALNIILNLETTKRKNKVDEMIQKIRNKMNNMNVFSKVNISKNTGSPDWGRDLELQIICNNDIIRTLDFLILYAKYFIYQCKRNKDPPFFPSFLLQVRNHIMIVKRTGAHYSRMSFLELIYQHMVF